jgi:hypothetical protein
MWDENIPPKNGKNTYSFIVWKRGNTEMEWYEKKKKKNH